MKTPTAGRVFVALLLLIVLDALVGIATAAAFLAGWPVLPVALVAVALGVGNSHLAVWLCFR